MKRTKSLLSLALVLIMLFSLVLPGGAMAVEDPTKVDIGITKVEEGVYKLSYKATATEKLYEAGLVMSYDNAVIAPAKRATPFEKIEVKDGDNQSTSNIKYAINNPLKEMDEALYTSAIATYVQTKRTGITCGLACAKGSGTMPKNTVMFELYFRLVEGKQESDLKKGSFKIETATGDGTFLNRAKRPYGVMVKTATDLSYGNGDSTHDLPVTLTYPNSTVDTLVSTAIKETPALTVAVPTKAEATKTLQLAVTNTGVDGAYVGNAATTWSIPTTTGVSIDASSGLLTVRPDASSGSVTVTASTKAGTVTTTDTATVSITKETAAVAEVLIYKGSSVSGAAITADTITVPDKGAAAAAQAYTAQAYDQYGAVMNGQTYVWSVVTALTGASITPENTAATTVSIAAASVAGDYKIKAAVGSVGSELTITTTRNAAVATTIAITSGSDIVIPADNNTVANDINFPTAVKDQYDTQMINPDVKWTIKAADNSATGEGISINGSKVSVTNAAKNTIKDTTGKLFTITASCGNVTATKTVTIKRAAATATSVKIFNGATEVDGSTSIVIPLSGTNKVVTYTPKLFDQYGTEMTAPTWAWTVPTGLPTGTTFSDGTVTVAMNGTPADANTGSFKLKATGSNLSKEITINITKINASWSDIKTAKSPVYGTTNGDIISGAETTTMSYNLDGGKTYDLSLSGSYVVTNSTTAQGAGDKTITVTFTANQDATNGEYKGVVLTNDFPVKIGKATPTAAQLQYTIPTNNVYTAAPQGIGNVTANGVVGLGAISVKYDGSANVPTNAGTYAVTAEIVAGDNYAASTSAISLGNYTIGAAEITGFQTTAPTHTVLANADANKSLAALQAIAASGNTLPEKVTVTYGSNKTADLLIAWAASTDTYNVKGGTYTYKGTVTNGKNFKAYATTLDAKVKVTPVTVQTIVNTDGTVIAATVTKAKAAVTAAGDLAAIGVPANVKVTFDGGVTEETSAASWDKTRENAKSVAASVTETSGDKTIVFTLQKGTIPDWATLPTSMPTITLTITNKYPVTVSFTTAVADVTYGDTLATPVATQTAIKNGTDTNGKFKYTYVGVSPTVYAESATVPTEAGSYKVIATLVSNTHSGTAVDEFTIAKKNVTITFTNTANLTYDKTQKAVTAAVTGKNGSDDVSAVLSYSGKDAGTSYPASAAAPVNAGSYTAKVTGLTGVKAGNYNLTSTLTHNYNIAKAERNLACATAATLNLAGDKLTGEVGKTTFADLDKSAVVKYASEDTAVATVNNGGRVTAVGNDTAVINATIAATDNYNAQAAIVVANVTAVTTPITGITVTGGTGDKLSASISGNTIKLAGFVTKDATITVTPAYATNAELKNGSKTTLVATDEEALKAGGSFIVTAFTTIDVKYIIDTSAVVLKATNVEMGETDDVTDADDIKDATEKTEVTTALNDAATKAEDLLAAATKALLEGAGKKNEELTEEQKADLGSGYKIKTEVYLKISATAYTSQKSLALEITPWVKYSGVAGTSGTAIPDLGSAKLDNSAIKAPVKISLALPTGFPNEKLFAKHTKLDGTVEILAVTVTTTGGKHVATWYQSSFSKTELFADSRTGSISYTFEDGTQRIINYTAKDIGTALPTDTKSGNTFNGWNIKDVTGVQKTMTEALLTEINGGKTATPSFTPAFSGGGDTTSNLTINASAGEGGTITPSGKLAVEKNGSMSFAIKPNEGYSIDTILVDGKAIGKVSSYTFKNVTENHSIAVTFKKGDDFAKFIDVKGHWAESAMRFVFENEIMSGMSQITFEPETELSRAMLVTMLYRIDGKPAVSSKPSFKDVASGMWYTDAIAWAEANKIISGMGDGNFAPNASIQRQQMAAILYRYMQFKGRDVSGSSELTAFTDAKMIGDWALPAMKWAVQEKLISGRTTSTLEPLGTAKRAEVAMVMMRWLQK